MSRNRDLSGHETHRIRRVGITGDDILGIKEGFDFNKDNYTVLRRSNANFVRNWVTTREDSQPRNRLIVKKSMSRTARRFVCDQGTHAPLVFTAAGVTLCLVLTN